MDVEVILLLSLNSVSTIKDKGFNFTKIFGLYSLLILEMVLLLLLSLSLSVLFALFVLLILDNEDNFIKLLLL